MESKITASHFLSTVHRQLYGFNNKKYVNLKPENVPKELIYLDHLVSLMCLAKMDKIGIPIVFYACVPTIHNGMENAVFLVQEVKIG